MGVVPFLLCLTSSVALAILPLPYSTEPEDVAQEIAEIEKDPKTIAGYRDLYEGSRAREMELPEFGNQPGAIGYSGDETFAVPAELRPRVDFWKKIYAEYTSRQALLHDPEWVEITYDVLDIGAIAGDSTLPPRRRMRALAQYLKAEKQKISSQLKTIHQFRNEPHNLPLELIPLFKKFQAINEPDKFLLAAERVRAQVGQRDRIVEGFLYGGRYFSKLTEIFEQKGVPKELTRLPLVESAFNLSARSKVGASGIWQFMRSTGKLFMRVDKFIDERNDPVTAAWAAAELLRRNFERLQAWPLAITAYNHGPEGMARAVATLGTRDLSQIIKNYKGRTFGFASSNFYCEFLAILEVEKDYRKHFGKLMVDAPIRYDEFPVGDNVKFDDLAKACRVEEAQLTQLNLALTDWVVSGRGHVPQGYRLKVPVGKLADCESGFRNVRRVSSTSPPARLKRARLTMSGRRTRRGRL